MEQFTSAQKKLTLALLSLCGALALLGTATYAWYTLSTAPEVSGIEFGVSAAQALLVSNQKDRNYQKQLKLNDMSNIAPLVPASTLDGLNWFVCRYEPNGDVREQKSKTATGGQAQYFNNQFDYLRFPHGGNQTRRSTAPTVPEGSNVQSTFWQELEDRSLYAWQDIYLKTTEKQVQVHIANGVQNLTDPEKQDENYHYGTYVLGYSLEQTDENNITVRMIQGGAETCVRVGLLVLEEYYENGDANSSYVDKNKFFILEPNADTRSAADKTDSAYNADVYVPGFKVKQDLAGLIGESPANAGETGAGETGTGEGSTGEGEGGTGESSMTAWQKANGWYLPTYPVTLRTNENDYDDLIDSKTSAQRVEEKFGAGQNETEAHNHSLPTEDERNDYIALAADGTPGLNQDNLIVMTTSNWDKTLQTSTQEEAGEESGTSQTSPLTVNGRQLTYDSRVVGTFGQFVPTGSLYTTGHETATAAREFWAEQVEGMPTLTASQQLFTLTKDRPVKVRLYFWVEGQDIDCWNDISKSNFLVNLELSGEVTQTG